MRIIVDTKEEKEQLRAALALLHAPSQTDDSDIDSFFWEAIYNGAIVVEPPRAFDSKLPNLGVRTETLEIRASPGRGRGVFALQDFRKGEVIERCPLIVVSPKEYQAVAETTFKNYFFQVGHAKVPRSALPLGYGAIYNHSFRPNAYYEDSGSGANMIKTFVAHKDIKSGEEILVNYHGEPGRRAKVWFEVK